MYYLIVFIWALASLFIGLCGYPGFVLTTFVHAAKDNRSFGRSAIFFLSLVVGLAWWMIVRRWVIPHSTFLTAHYESTLVAIFFLSVIVFIDSVSGLSLGLFWKWFGPTSMFSVGYDKHIDKIPLSEWRRLQNSAALKGGEISLVAFSHSVFRCPAWIQGPLAKKWSLKRVIKKHGTGRWFELTQKHLVGIPDLPKIFVHDDVFSMMDATEKEWKRYLELQKGVQAIFALAEEDKERYRSPACQALRENLQTLLMGNLGVITERSWKEFFRARNDDFWTRQEARKPRPQGLDAMP